MTDATVPTAETTRALVRRAREAAADAPDAVRARAALEVVDAAGCMTIGASHPLVQRVSRAASQWQEGGQFPSFATDGRVSLEQAVVLDSLACHVDEFDSLHPASAVVASATVVPAALQVAAWQGLGGREVVDAVLAGYAAVTRLGERWGGPQMYSRGWWPTSSFAAVGAAVAAGTLLRLEDTALTHAIAIAAAGSGGLLSDDGFGEGHYLSAAEASARGVRAAFLARGGAQGSWSYLDGPARRAFGPDHEPAGPHETPWDAVTSSVIKLYPCARPLQGFASALAQLADDGVDLREVREVRLGLPEPLLRFVNARKEVDGPTEAAASAAFVYAAVRDGRAAEPLFFREATLVGRDPVPPVSLAPDPEAQPGSWAGILSLVEGSGRHHRLRASAPESVTEGAVTGKFHANLAAAGTSPEQANRTAAALLSLDEVPTIAALRLPALASDAF